MSDMVLVIEKGIPLPRAKRGHGPSVGPVRATIGALDIGDSVVVPTVQHDLKKTQTRAGGVCWLLKPKQFATRVVTENGRRVVRVWRVA